MLSTLKSFPKTTLAWILLSIVIVIAHLLLPKAQAYDMSAIILSIIAAIYVGFALQDGRRFVIVQEVSAASLFIVFAFLGLWYSPYFWVLGLILHGIWDWLHHTKTIKTQVPDYYPPVCVVVDWSLALFLLIWLSSPSLSITPPIN